MIVYGFLSMALALFLYPFAGNIYPNLILIRLIFSNGICAVTTQPLLADYVSNKTKGFGGGIVKFIFILFINFKASVVSGFGAIFAAVVLIKLINYYPIHYVYWITGGLCVLIAFVCLFGIKNVPIVKRERTVKKRL
jgi:MFS family permease